MGATMAYLNDLCRTVREQHDLTLEAMAGKSDFSISAISRWELGEHEMPARYLRDLFAATRDMRLLQYFDPAAAQLVCETRPKRLPPAQDLGALLPALIADTRKLTGALELVERIVRDGRVDESDDLALAKCHELLFAVVDGIGHVNRSLTVYRQASEPKAVRP